jgi:hypothetical protein
MSTTIETRPGIEELRDLDPAGVLEFACDQRRAAERAEARLLAAAVHWVDLHPVTEDHPAATQTIEGPVFAALKDRDRAEDVALGGVGTPGVARYAVEELAATLGLSYQAGLAVVVQAVELAFRLPRLWALVQAGRLSAWQARRVTGETIALSRESVEFVDRHLAVAASLRRMPGMGRLRSLVHEARLHCDPDQADAVEEAALAHRGVWFDHRESTATTDLIARLDTLDALDLETAVGDLAAEMGRLGDDRPLEVRRATALGLLAHPQRALDLANGIPLTPDTPRGVTTPAGTDAAAGPGTSSTCGGCGSRALLYFHVTAADLTTHLETGHGGGTVEKLGAGTLTLLSSWLQRIGHVSIRPVLTVHRTHPAPDDSRGPQGGHGAGYAVDVHNPPGWMREEVQVRDGHCVFPDCPIDARNCDLDHIEPYLDPDTGGPPGQTHAGNLACVCRRHHRLKTFTAWTYRRNGDGSYTWTSPHGRTHTTWPGR